MVRVNQVALSGVSVVTTSASFSYIVFVSDTIFIQLKQEQYQFFDRIQRRPFYNTKKLRETTFSLGMFVPEARWWTGRALRPSRPRPGSST